MPACAESEVIMNKNRPKGNQKHIDLSGRIRIEQGLNNGESFRSIARDLKVKCNFKFYLAKVNSTSVELTFA